jgi:hypothetical protein
MTASLWLAGFLVFDDQYVLLYKATQTLPIGTALCSLDRNWRRKLVGILYSKNQLIFGAVFFITTLISSIMG